jgi:hypothetical protein
MSKKKKEVEGSKGIHDPWRLGTDKWKPPEGDVPVGTPGSHDDFDWDLRPDSWYIFRVQGAALKVMNAKDPEEAALQILKAYREEPKFQQVVAEAGFVDLGKQDANMGFVFKTETGTLCCPDAESVDDGLQRLVKALRAAVRNDRSMKPCLARLGIIPLVE